MINDGCRNGLVQRDRRSQLTENDRAALEAHLDACEECRLTHLIGQDFDVSGTVEEHDATRLDRLVQAANRWVEQPRRPTRSNRARLLLAAMAVSAAAAAATLGSSRIIDANRSTQSSTEQTLDASSRLTGPRESPTSQNNTLSLPSAATLDMSATPTAELATALVAPVALPRVRPATTVSAEALLARANQARRSGETNESIQLFRRLQREYPKSREAGLSFVALGALLLDQGQAQAALDQFNQYLHSNAGILTAEALFGKGRALERINLFAEEAPVWRRLLADFPQSPYAAHARRRLATEK